MFDKPAVEGMCWEPAGARYRFSLPLHLQDENFYPCPLALRCHAIALSEARHFQASHHAFDRCQPA